MMNWIAKLFIVTVDAEEMEKIFGVDSLGFLNLEDVSKLGEGGGCTGYCMACFDGNYPTNPPSTTNRNKYDIKLSESEI